LFNDALRTSASGRATRLPNSDKTKALAHLAGAVAHELNNIFTAVAGNLAFLEQAVDKTDPNAQLINDVVRTAHRGMAMAEKLQAFAGRQPLQRTRVDLNEIVIRAVTQLKVSILSQVDVQLQLMRGRCVVIVDQTKLSRSFEDLASNAAAAMDHGGTLTIASEVVVLKPHEIDLLPAGTYAKLTIRDRGKGMAPDIAARATEPFFTTKTARSAETGWGLSKVVGFVRQCGGTLVLASAPGLGTVVEIYLPKPAD
jgi:signal transduction histidine kinase